MRESPACQFALEIIREEKAVYESIKKYYPQAVEAEIASALRAQRIAEQKIAEERHKTIIATLESIQQPKPRPVKEASELLDELLQSQGSPSV